MKNQFEFIIFALSLLLFSACQKEDLKTNNTFRIEFGSVCGWCAGEEIITVTKSKIEYIRVIPCGENEGQTELSHSLSKEKWDDLINNFNYDYFSTLDYNVCNVCADGCDDFIIVTKNGKTHEVRYTPGTEIEGFENFQEELEALMNAFREKN